MDLLKPWRPKSVHKKRMLQCQLPMLLTFNKDLVQDSLIEKLNKEQLKFHSWKITENSNTKWVHWKICFFFKKGRITVFTCSVNILFILCHSKSTQQFTDTAGKVQTLVRLQFCKWHWVLVDVKILAGLVYCLAQQNKKWDASFVSWPANESSVIFTGDVQIKQFTKTTQVDHTQLSSSY